MMNDREMLEMAAKAIGGKLDWTQVEINPGYCPRLIGHGVWSPRMFGGDSLWLAAKLDLEIQVMHGFGEVWCEDEFGIHRAVVDKTDDRARDYREAIFLCAVEIGRSMP